MSWQNIHTLKNQNRKKMLVFAFLFSLALLSLAMYWFSERNRLLDEDYATQNLQSLQQQKFDNIILGIVKTSSAVRGYAGTRQPEFARGFRRNIDSINAGLNHLRILQKDSKNSIDSRIFAEFDSLATAKAAFVSLIYGYCEKRQFDSALAMLTTKKGIGLNETILRLNESVSAIISNRQWQSQSRFSELNRRNNNLAYSSIIVSMAIIALVFYLLFEESKRVNRISNELNTQKEFMQITLKSLGEGLITTDNDGKIVYMNPAAENITGWRNTEAITRPLHSIYRIKNEETGLPFDNIVKRIIKEGKPVELENNTILSTKYDRNVVISNSGAPLMDKDGQVLGAVLVFNDITEKKETLDLLKENEQRFRNLIENIPEAVYTCDIDGYIQIYNKAAVKLWGREPQPGRDKWAGAWKILNTDGVEIPIENSPMAMAIKQQKTISGTELLIKRPDGTLRHVLPSPTPLFNTSGKLTGAVNMLFDITDKKQKDLLIKKTEEKYKNLFDQASDAILTWSFDGTIHEFNDIICDISGYTKQEFSSLALTDIVHGDLIMSSNKYESILAGESTTLYRKFIRKDGTLIDMEVKIKLLPDGKVLGMGRDITERLLYEKNLQKANEQYEILAMATSDTIWDWNVKEDSISYNSGIASMFGYELNNIEKALKWQRDNIHPDDKGEVDQLLKQAFENRSHNIQFEYRYRCADGSYKIIKDRAFVIYNENGEPARIIGAMQDITSEKMHERNMAITIVETQEKERKELGMELHDNVNQLLGATLLYLSIAKKSSGLGVDVSDTIADCIGYLNNAISEIRSLSHRLAPYTKSDFSLQETIEMLVEPIRKTNRYNITIAVDEVNESVIKTDLYRIIQAQLANILKHAGAQNIHIGVSRIPAGVRLIIKDDGKGFDPTLSTDGIGLHNIRHRAEIYGGSFSLSTSPGNGCEVKVDFPV